ncbi:MAG: DegT/DnrJ/EryC1/StrS family aminotransferase [Protaetiibacter sp.]
MAEVPFFDLGANERRLRERLHARLDEVLDGGYFVGGPIVERFERGFAEFVGAGFCAGVGNGLDAIRLILEAYGVGQGDEVIVPAFTYYASWLGVMQTGARIVAVDVDPDTANIDPTLVEAAITPRTRAILAVHLYGRPAAVEALRSIADRHGILLVEDAAQAHGALTPIGMTGAAGHAAAFSFYPTKNLGALGDAGAVTTSDPAIDRRIRSRRSYGQGSAKYDHVDTGWNSRLDPLQAAFLEVHLEHLDEWTAVRRRIAARYVEALGGAASSIIGADDIEGSVWHHVVVRAERRDDFRAHLLAQGVHTDVHYPYWLGEVAPALDALAPGAATSGFAASERLARTVTSLPVGPWMTDAQVDQVAAALANAPRDLIAPA